jgi:hypothetical protein
MSSCKYVTGGVIEPFQQKDALAEYYRGIQLKQPLLEAIGKACTVLDILMALKDPLSAVGVALAD